MTPNIIEERSLNVAVMDVYSRLMMDRIIFLGYPINDEIANIVTAQLLFLDSSDIGIPFLLLGIPVLLADNFDFHSATSSWVRAAKAVLMATPLALS